MRRLVVGLALLIVSASVLKAANAAPEVVPGPPATAEDAVAGVAGVRPQGLSPGGYGYNYALLYVVVINAPGRNNTFFTTDVFFSNGRNVSQEVIVAFLAAGVSNVGASAMRYQLAPGTTYNVDNFLGTGTGRLNKTGVGALIMTAVLAGTNTVDKSAMLYGAARIATPEPGSSGTNSFTEWATFQNTIHGDFQCVALGGRQNASFRSNYVLVNLDMVPRAFTTIFIAGANAQVTNTIPALSMQELAVPDLTPTSNGYFLAVFFPVDTADFPWNGALVTADNITGDAWLNPITYIPQAEY